MRLQVAAHVRQVGRVFGRDGPTARFRVSLEAWAIRGTKTLAPAVSGGNCNSEKPDLPYPHFRAETFSIGCRRGSACHIQQTSLIIGWRRAHFIGPKGGAMGGFETESLHTGDERG